MQKLLFKAASSMPVFAVLLALIMLVVLISSQTQALQVQNRTIKSSNSKPSETGVVHDISFDIMSNSVVGSVVIEYCENSPIENDICTFPTGFSTSASTISNQSGITDFSVDVANSTPNRIVLTRPAAQLFGPGNNNFELNNITNPDNIGPYFARIYSHAATNGLGPLNHSGGIALSIDEEFAIDAEVPPFLYLCVGVVVPGYDCQGNIVNYIDFGEFSASSPKYASSEFIVATNAGLGFSVYVTGDTPTSGNNIIPGLTSPTPSSVGESQFGINIRNNSNPDIGSDPVGLGTGVVSPDYNTPNRFKYVSGDSVVYSNDTTLDRKFTTSYIINISNNQRPGIYNTTMLYTALATF